MDDLKRAKGLRTSIADAADKLFSMESSLEKATQEILSLDSKIQFLEDTIKRLKNPGVAVSLSEYSKMRTDLRTYYLKKKTIEIETFNVQRAMDKLEHVMELDSAELDYIERTQKTLPFRRNDD